MALPFAALQDDVSALVSRWRGQRAERQARRTLDPGDFAALRTAGLLRTVVPESADLDGLWRDAPTSTRPIAELLRSIARADPAVALVSAMHPAVIGFWLLNPEPADERWEEQRAAVFASAAAGEQWGTITSEPGSGGDIARTRAVAEPSEQPAPLPGRTYVLSGEKHFGSGSGITDRMITTAVPSGEDAPAFFAIDVRGRPWDGSAGMVLRAEWDGMGMAATQSHAMLLDRVPAVRMETTRPLAQISATAGPFVATLFTAVVLGVVDEAVAVARSTIAATPEKAASLRAFEQVEWTRASSEHWLAVQAYEGALRAIERSDPAALHAALCAKECVAELAESVLSRLSRVIGGGTFSRRSPFAHWFEDVRALGFLRPPWGLAFDSLFGLSLTAPSA